MKHIVITLLISATVLSVTSKPKVNWLSFEALEISLLKAPKKVVIYFYADWCVYCKKMDAAVYKKPEIVAKLNKDYYAVKFNAESKDTIRLGDRIFLNPNQGKQPRVYHQIPELLAGRKNHDLVLPATVILDDNFNVIQRYYRYISPKEMLSILK